jgi:hypothetical protein
MRVALLVMIWLIAPMAFAADSNRIIALEQDVRNLERLVSTLQREVRELRQQQRGSVGRDGAALHDEPVAASDAWLNAAKWQALRVGASEMEVIETLGPPTSMRAADGTRVLLYAMEIGSTGFLGGSVTLKDREVIAIEPPVLK